MNSNLFDSIAIIVVMLMIMLLIAIGLSALPAHALTCQDVRAAVKTQPKAVIESYKQMATPEQLRAAYQCLASRKHR